MFRAPENRAGFLRLRREPRDALNQANPGSRARSGTTGDAAYPSKVPTGLSVAIPHGYEGQVRPRSGLAAKHGITVANAPGTVDSDYRGEMMVCLVNLGREPFTLTPLERVAQIVFARHEVATLVEVDDLDATARGAGGYGSTDG